MQYFFCFDKYEKKQLLSNYLLNLFLYKQNHKPKPPTEGLAYKGRYRREIKQGNASK